MLFRSGFSSYINILAKYGQINNENMKVILSGVGANSGTILKFLQSFIPFDINAVEMLTHKSIYGEEIVLAEFVNVYGAAIRQFSKDKKIKTIGINDIPTILEYIKNKSEVIPITILCVSVTVLGAYYCFIKYKAPKINKIIAQLEAQKDEYDNARSTYDSLNDRVLEIEKNTRLYNDKIHFLSEEIGIKREYLVNLLRGISKFSESGLMIQTLKPDNMDKMLFNIDGESYNISSINTLISGLQLQSWCAYAKVININKAVYIKEEIIEEDKSYDENIIQDEDDYNSDKETKNDNTIRTEVVSYKFNIKVLLN